MYRRDYGDGAFCPVPGHGRMFVRNGVQWCPNQEHDVPGSPPSFFQMDGTTPAKPAKAKGNRS